MSPAGVEEVENRELTARARRALAGHWALAVVGFAIFPAISLGTSLWPLEPLGQLAISVLLTGPFSLGMARLALSLAGGKPASLSQVFEAFDGVRRFGTAVVSYVLMVVFILFWLLFLVIPGIAAALSYAMLFFVLAEDDEIGPLAALTRSREMMLGHRWRFLELVLRFVGWYLVCVLTLGIGFFWVYPYQTVSFAQFYRELKRSGPREGAEAAELMPPSPPGDPGVGGG